MEVFKINKIFYFSDGSVVRYKNKEKVLKHKTDFGIDASDIFCHITWNYCDGLGGTVKRHVIKAREEIDLM